MVELTLTVGILVFGALVGMETLWQAARDLPEVAPPPRSDHPQVVCICITCRQLRTAARAIRKNAA